MCQGRCLAAWVTRLVLVALALGGCGILRKPSNDVEEEPFVEEDAAGDELAFVDAQVPDVVDAAGADVQDAAADAAPDVKPDAGPDVDTHGDADAAPDQSDSADADDMFDTGPLVCSPAQVAACDDANPCTDDTCDYKFGCNHIYVSVPCNDGSACTVNDTCLDGQCVGSAVNCDDGKVCTTDVCPPSVGCVHQNAPGPCDDGNVCTVGEACKAGVCIGGSPADCSDGIACTLDTCEPGSGCAHSSGDGPCDDESYCTVGETCTGGVCAGGSPALCNDGNECTSDGCDPPSGCTFTVLDGKCDDNNPCSGPDVCKAGGCVGAALVCVPADACHSAGVCNSVTGTCSPVNAPDGVSCNDGLACTKGDSCAAGACVGENQCDDADVCTLDTCSAQGGCTHKPGCTVGGTVSGLSGGALKAVSGAHAALVTTDGAFTLSGGFANGANYFTTLSLLPSNPAQRCTVANASGAIHGGNVSDVQILCGACGDGTVGADPVWRVDLEWLVNSQTPATEFMDCWINNTQIIHVDASTPEYYCDVLPQRLGISDPKALSAIQAGKNEFSCQFAQNVAWIVATVRHASGRAEQVILYDYPNDSGGTHDAIRRNSACPGYIWGSSMFVVQGQIVLQEGCDDGNLDDGDGCSSICMPEDCTTGMDADADGLDDCYETATGVFVDQTHTGTSPALWDTDGDGLGDGDELLGTPTGLDLAALGALPLRADIFVEADWMADSQGCGQHAHQITPAGEAMAVQMFANAPRVNPDGSNGIALHIDYGQGGKWTGGNNAGTVVEFPPEIGMDLAGTKSTHFNVMRLGYFHYALMMHSLGPAAGGIGELTGDDFIVASGGCDVCFKCQGTDILGHLPIEAFCHELGHNLGLNHGGDTACNGKPNYPSIMNYRHAYFGVDEDCDDVPDDTLDYARGDRAGLDEAALDEADGVCGKFWIDWNKDGSVSPAVKQDLNGEYDATCDGTWTKLYDFDDWGRLVFSGVTSGVAPAAGAGRVPAVCYDDPASVAKRRL